MRAHLTTLLNGASVRPQIDPFQLKAAPLQIRRYIDVLAL